MSLAPVNDTPGLWVNPDWQSGQPGTFAVIIGVSHYRHLDGGGDAADDLGKPWIREARRLGQLPVSASTAQGFFTWLKNDYRYPSAPLARCWLLLAPTPQEQAREPLLMEHAADPTIAACEQAIRSWSDAMQRLPAAAQQGSRALFFFSGHGIQVYHDKQLLLPSDYLGGVLPHWDDALSTGNLLAGLDSLQVPERLFFLDACRNDFPEIRKKRPQGRSILTEDETAASYPDTRLSAILYATAASLQAWSPADPTKGPSLFGQALLEGLAGRPDIELKERDGHYAVELGKLQGFTTERVVQILASHQATVAQRVTMGGPVVDGRVTVTEIPRGALAAIRPEIAIDPGAVTRGASPPAVARSATVRGMALQDLLANALTVSRSLPVDIGRPLPTLDIGPSRDPGFEDARRGVGSGTGPSAASAADASDDGVVATDAFGNRPIAEIWTRHSRLLPLSSRTATEADSIRIERVERDDRARSFRIAIVGGTGDPRGYWLQVRDSHDAAHGVMLPSLGRTVRYRVEAEIATDKSLVSVSRLEATLARSNTGALGEAARLWERYRTADVTEAVSHIDLDALRETVRGKQQSPLAATVAALVLLRANRLDLIDDWLVNLADGFPLLPDGAVLRAEQLMRQPSDRALAVPAAAASLCRLEERGLPFTGEAMSYAASLAERLGRAAHLVPSENRDRLDRVRERIADALVYFRPGGLFTAYAGFDPDWAARLLLPAEQGIRAGQTAANPNDAPAPSTGNGSLGSEAEKDEVEITDNQVIIGGVRLDRQGE